MPRVSHPLPRPRPRHRFTIRSHALSILGLVLCLPALNGWDAPVQASDRGVTNGVVSAHSQTWLWPVEAPRTLLRGFEAPPTPYAAGHRGIDLEMSPGRSVFAPANGVVTFAGAVVDRPVLSILHDGGLVSSFEPVSALVAPGEAVSAGQLVGVVATGGHCAERCVHIGARLDGRYLNPLIPLGLLERAVLLPLRLDR